MCLTFFKCIIIFTVRLLRFVTGHQFVTKNKQCFLNINITGTEDGQQLLIK